MQSWVSCFWKRQVSETHCVQQRGVLVEDENLKLMILAIKLALLDDYYGYLDPQDGLVQ